MRRSAEKASFRYLIPLIKYMKRHAILLGFAILFATVGTVLTVVGPNYIRKIADIIGEGLYGEPVDIPAVLKTALFLIFLHIISFIMDFFQSYFMTVTTQKTGYRLRREINRKINVLPLKFFDDSMVGDLLSRVTNDVDSICFTMMQSVGALFQAGTQFIGSIIIMMIINWTLAVTAIGAAALGFVILLLITKNSQKYFVAQQAELGCLTGQAEEVYTNHSIVKVYNGEEQEREKFNTINDRLYNATWKSQFLSGIMIPVMGFVGNLGYVAVCVAGAVMAARGTITFGVVVAFMIYVRLFTNPLQQLGRIFTQLQGAAAASKRVFEFLEEEEIEDDSYKERQLSPDRLRGEIVFEHVKFGYTPDKLIIKDFCAKAEKGQKIAIVGPTGAGKTTLVNLLMRFYEIEEGRITIDGVDMKEMSRAEVRNLFGMVLQDAWLYEGTFKDNIMFSKNATDEEVINAAKMVGIHHFIKTMPQGYDTVLNEEVSVSQGQRQLITIARAMVKDAPFLIFDEATSSVDTRTEKMIQEAMDRLMKGRTSFVIAHRLSTIKNADLIFVMNNGDIIEQGNHDELMSKNGFYAELYNSQFESVE
ncbi:MAG: ABC transporter ATP-binding protein [Lachnospiraceae bacterium]|jgi:ATP-binding cassette subfamily B multidrug efflux pump